MGFFHKSAAKPEHGPHNKRASSESRGERLSGVFRGRLGLRAARVRHPSHLRGAECARGVHAMPLTVDISSSPSTASPCRFVASAHKLGSGAYGAVLLGTDLCTSLPVAIKFIPDGRMRPTSLEREVLMLRRLSGANHPALVKFHAHVRPNEVHTGEVRANGTLPLSRPLGSHHALVMEVARGGELFDYVVKHDGLYESESAPLAAQLCDAVRAAHALGIAHRDLKLENVLLVGRPGEADARRIKLIDWGLAHQHALAPDGSVVPERLHSRCGSRSYMAPEVTSREACASVGYNGFAADVWSLGVCLFAIHLGFFPFEQANPEHDWRARRVVAAQREGRSTMATILSFYPQRPVHLSAALLHLIDRMLVFDPSRRATLTDVLASDWLAPYVPAICPMQLDLASTRVNVQSATRTTSSSISSGGAPHEPSPHSHSHSHAYSHSHAGLSATASEGAAAGAGGFSLFGASLVRQESARSTSTASTSLCSSSCSSVHTHKRFVSPPPYLPPGTPGFVPGTHFAVAVREAAIGSEVAAGILSRVSEADMAVHASAWRQQSTPPGAPPAAPPDTLPEEVVPSTCHIRQVPSTVVVAGAHAQRQQQQHHVAKPLDPSWPPPAPALQHAPAPAPQHVPNIPSPEPGHTSPGHTTSPPRAPLKQQRRTAEDAYASPSSSSPRELLTELFAKKCKLARSRSCRAATVDAGVGLAVDAAAGVAIQIEGANVVTVTRL